MPNIPHLVYKMQDTRQMSQKAHLRPVANQSIKVMLRRLRGLVVDVPPLGRCRRLSSKRSPPLTVAAAVRDSGIKVLCAVCAN